ncbi:trypsin-like serine protease [Nonomuraea sp. NPDC049750]|uniref:trypsin-like serine protease n=1 Tax=Nonomuraea sp. NPDC049750 TaxID=3154738 RepID=UPI0033FE1026
MRSRLLLVVPVALAALAATATPSFALRGGVESVRPYSFMGSLQRAESPRADGHVCGVTLIAPRWVVTASHCARTPNQAPVGTPRGWRVRIGSLSVTSGGELAEVDKFYRYSTEVYGKDLALLRLRTPVRAKPARIAPVTPADRTATRIIGWGVTCDERAPKCYPDRLREADTVVRPDSACEVSGITAKRELCVGSLDGSISATNMDSGGPALVRRGGSWLLAGAVSGSNSNDTPTVYSDVSVYRKWIRGIVTGSAVPPEPHMPSLEGAAQFGDCSGAVVRTGSDRAEDPALLLTNGHCVQGTRPAPGSALVDQPAAQPVTITDREGYPKVEARTTRLVYATMTGTDVALYRLDRTYAELAAADAKVFDLATTPAAAGDRVDLLSGNWGRRWSCAVKAVVPGLREGGYEQENALTYTSACEPGHGASGSPLIAPDGQTVVGLHSTSNDDGKSCTENNPCEVDAAGHVTVRKGAHYGQQVAAVPACLAPGSVLDLSLPGCTLPRPAA